MTGQAQPFGGREMCQPGDTVSMAVSLDKPITVESGTRFAIREGGKTVGSGMVTRVN